MENNYVNVSELNVEELKMAYTHKKDYWKVSKDNEFPLVNLFFFEIQSQKEIDLDFEEFLIKYNLNNINNFLVLSNLKYP